MNRTDCPEFPHLAKEVQPLLGLFSNEYVSVPLQVLRDGGAHELEWLHYTVLFVGGSAGGFLLKSTIISPVLSVLSLYFERLYTGRRALGRVHIPEGRQCWSWESWMWVCPASLAGDPPTDWGGHGELGQFVWEKVRHDGIEGRTEVHI